VLRSVDWLGDSRKEWRTLQKWVLENPNATRRSSFQKRFSINVWAGTAVSFLVVACEVANRVAGIQFADFRKKHVPSTGECTNKCLRKHVCLHDGVVVGNQSFGPYILLTSNNLIFTIFVFLTSIVLFSCLKQNVLETGSCLRSQVKANSVVPNW
jgi:hypothetical protein